MNQMKPKKIGSIEYRLVKRSPERNVVYVYHTKLVRATVARIFG